MKRNIQYYNNGEGKRMRCVRLMEETTEENCVICNNIKYFLSLPDDERPKQVVGLAKGNLARHLKTNKHWKIVDEYAEEMILK